jgi:hypothetical protein
VQQSQHCFASSSRLFEQNDMARMMPPLWKLKISPETAQFIARPEFFRKARKGFAPKSAEFSTTD